MADNTSKYIEAIEKVNSDYLHIINRETAEQRLGHQLILLKKSFPFKTISLIRNHMKWARIDQEVEKLSIPKVKELFYNCGSPMSDAKGAAYTCITGSYDRLYDPVLDVEKLEYFVFSDKGIGSTKWKTRKIDKIAGSFDNTTNRYYKFHPYELFDGYDYSIYMDGNVQAVSDISTLYSVAKQARTGIAMHIHTERDCIYNEGKACIIHGRGNKEKIERQLDFYKKEGMPEHFGMLEATIIVVDLHNQTAKSLLDQWWEQYIKWDSGRDQLAFSYILWKNGFSLEDVGILGNNKFYNPKFRVFEHAEWRK